jgi:hypothetical protein
MLSTCVALHCLYEVGERRPLEGQHFAQSGGGVPVSGGNVPGGDIGASISHSPKLYWCLRFNAEIFRQQSVFVQWIWINYCTGSPLTRELMTKVGVFMCLSEYCEKMHWRQSASAATHQVDSFT